MVVTLLQSYFLHTLGLVENIRNSLPCDLLIGSQCKGFSQGHFLAEIKGDNPRINGNRTINMLAIADTLCYLVSPLACNTVVKLSMLCLRRWGWERGKGDHAMTPLLPSLRSKRSKSQTARKMGREGPHFSRGLRSGMLATQAIVTKRGRIMFTVGSVARR